MDSSTAPVFKMADLEQLVQLTESYSNYSAWKSGMEDYIRSKGLIGYIDGSIPSPPEIIDGTENPDFSAWKEMDELVYTWIVFTIHEIFHDSLSAFHLWTAITEKASTIETTRHLERRNESEVEITQTGNGRGLNTSKYIPLSAATLNGDWEEARKFLEKEPDAINMPINEISETALMIAARSTGGVNFVTTLLARMQPSDLLLFNKEGLTALHMASAIGNIEVARLLVEKNPLLPYEARNYLYLPLHFAAMHGQKLMFEYLLKVTRDTGEISIFEGESGGQLLLFLVTNEVYDIACSMLIASPNLGYHYKEALCALAKKQEAFKSGTKLNLYQSFLYSWVPHTELKDFEDYTMGKVGSKNTTSRILSVKQKLYKVLWKMAEMAVPQMQRIQNLKTSNHHALEFVKLCCFESLALDYKEALDAVTLPVFEASRLGVPEVVEEILSSFPALFYQTDQTGRNIFHHAIINRRVNIFNLIYQVRYKTLILAAADGKENTCLHLAGLLVNQQKVDLMEGTAGSSLPMQRELQWFKAVEKLMLKTDLDNRNNDEKTAAMVFTESHREVVSAGEQWVKETSNSCTIAAALIVTIVFAAAITVPGGNNGENGNPIFGQKVPFIVFAISDALALFSSTSSVLMFLSIYTSRYRQQDFLYAIPKRLIIGLATLFASIIFMMVAFGATLCIMFGRGRTNWILVPVVGFSCLPITLFICLQFPLLWDMLVSTYGPSIFRQKSNRILY